MKLKINLINMDEDDIFENIPKSIDIEYKPDMTIKELKQILRFDSEYELDLAFETYYKDVDMYQRSRRLAPYILINGKIHFDYAYDDIKIEDIIKTHDINLKTGINIGYNHKVLCSIDWWGVIDVVIPVIKELAFILGLAMDIMLREFILKRYKGDQIPNPKTIQNFLYTRAYWNKHELSEMFEISLDEAKSILKLFGYKWNNRKQVYEINFKEMRSNKVKLEKIIEKNVKEYFRNN